MKHLNFETTVLFSVIISIVIVAFFIAPTWVSEIIDGIADIGF